MIYIYRLFTNLLYPILILIIFVRKFYNKEHPIRYKEKIFPSKFNVKRKYEKYLIWFHAASIGEYKSIIPIIKRLNENRGHELEILITTTTLSSGNLAEEITRKYRNIYHRYFPIDVLFLIKKFISRWKPNFIFLVDSEIWPNLILTSSKNKIPIGLINARITNKSFNKWKLLNNFAKSLFGSLKICLTSNNETKEFLKQLGVKNVFYIGNLKFAIGQEDEKINNINDKVLSKSKFWFAASTHRGEENICIKTHLSLRERHNNLITVIAPRHINRVESIAKFAKNLKLNYQILHKNENILNNKEIVIINSFGELQKYFKYAKSAFIGKSMIKKFENSGGQNPIEAAKFGCKVYHGPYVYNFEEIYQVLAKQNFSKKINDFSELAENINRDLIDSSKKNLDISKFVDDLGNKILNETMSHVNKLTINES